MQQSYQKQDRRDGRNNKGFGGQEYNNNSIIRGARTKIFKVKKPYESYGFDQKGKYRIIGVPKAKKKEKVAEIKKEKIADNFPNLWKELDVQVHTANRTL